MQYYTKYELARLIGARALQISYGAPPLIKVLETDNPKTIAKRELKLGVLPVFVVR